MSRPVVSAVITTYNQAEYIEAAVESVLGQTFPVEDIVVVDDGSTDDTAARLARFAGEIRYIRQDNRGVAGARNTGVQHARGSLIALLDGDDVWVPDKIRVQVAAAVAHPVAGLVAVDGVAVSGETVIRRSLFGAALRDVLGPDGVTTIVSDGHRRLIQTNIITTTSQVMVPAAVLRDVGPSDERFPIASDYDLYLRIAERWPLALVSRSLVRWRYLATSVSGPEEERELRWGRDMLDVLRKHARLAEPPRRRRLHRQVRQSLAGLVLEAYARGHRGHRRWATRYLLDLARRHPAHALVPLAFLAGLWSPRAVTARLGPRLRSRLRAPSP
jgi:glycosyltransferase involved in cell wall biosynthesis